MFDYLKRYYGQFRLLQKGSFRFFSVVKNYPAWRKSVSPGKSTLNDGVPWMTFDAINFLKRNITRNMRVFEYGSGGSTVFFSRLASEVVSVEHDKEWFLAVEKNLLERKINNWKGILCVPEQIKSGIQKNSSDPDQYGTSDNTFRNFSFEKYVKTIDSFPDNYFDLIVVDGRARPSCIKHGILKLKKNGFLLLDNADRANYQDAVEKYLHPPMILKLNLFGPTSHNPEFTLTKIWKKS